MRVATVKGERNLSELAGRLFQFKGPRAKALAKEAEAALLRANPHLRDLDKVAKGTIIVVPEVADVKPAEEAQPVGGGEMVGEVRRALGDIRSTLGTAAARHAEEANAGLKLLQSRELKALAEKVPALKERLEKMAEAAKLRLAEVKALETFREQALGQLDKDLSDLFKRLT